MARAALPPERKMPDGEEQPGIPEMTREHPLRVLVLVGTRPEAVKLAPVIAVMKARPSQFDVRVVVTAQHREMLDQVLEAFGIHPDVDLNLMASWPGRAPQLAELTSQALTVVDQVLARERPDVVVVQGDTTTVFVGALAAHFHRIPVAHVEAGLRTNERYNPFPEEANRRMATVLATFHFAPTEHARQNLLREGIPDSNIFVTGNTVVDALQGVVLSGRLERAELPPALSCLRDPAAPTNGTGHPRRILLATLHRRESWGEPMAGICRALRATVEAFPDTELVFPVHRNVRVRETVYPILQGVDRVHLVEPLEYVGFVYALSRCTFVVTDSGGIQEEAPSLAKPVLVLRETTERPEGIAAGTARLVGTDETAVREAMHLLLTDEAAYLGMARAASPYGDGRAAERIADVLHAAAERLPSESLPRGSWSALPVSNTGLGQLVTAGSGL
jgi:UDP-N-acetylglucosamine 2-epimerase (non-hydrolysing)